MTYFQLFLSFLKVGLFSIGGGYAAMPLIQNEVVHTHSWLSLSEFTDLITIAEMTPGPIAVNSATFVGMRIAGIYGAVIATIGCIFPSCTIVSILSYVYFRYKNVSALQSILSSLRPTIVALIAAAGLSILRLVIFSEQSPGPGNISFTGIVLFAAAFFLLRKLKWNPVLVMCLCGLANLFLGFVQTLPFL